MLTRKQHELLLFINRRLKATGVSPSFDEMKDAMGLKSKSGIHRLISALEERGFIRRLAHRARALEVVKLPEMAISPRAVSAGGANLGGNVVTADFRRHRRSDAPAEGSVEIPLHGRIAAGTPIEALENADSYLSLPPDMIGAGNHFALEISGDSMVEAGIFDGDTVVIKSGDTADSGDIVVALVDEQEATLKTLRKQGPQIALEPANQDHSTQVLPADRARIQGKMVALFRRC